MPQKKNPDGLELIRAKAAMTAGLLSGFLSVLKGLPTGYNKDLQDDKRPLFDAVDTMMLVLPAVAGALDELTFDTTKMRAAVSSASVVAPERHTTTSADFISRSIANKNGSTRASMPARR